MPLKSFERNAKPQQSIHPADMNFDNVIKWQFHRPIHFFPDKYLPSALPARVCTMNPYQGMIPVNVMMQQPYMVMPQMAGMIPPGLAAPHPAGGLTHLLNPAVSAQMAAAVQHGGLTTAQATSMHGSMVSLAPNPGLMTHFTAPPPVGTTMATQEGKKRPFPDSPVRGNKWVFVTSGTISHSLAWFFFLLSLKSLLISLMGTFQDFPLISGFSIFSKKKRSLHFYFLILYSLLNFK